MGAGGLAGINMSTQIKNSVYNIVWGDLDKIGVFNTPAPPRYFQVQASQVALLSGC